MASAMQQFGEFTDDNQDFSQTIKGLQLGTKNYYAFMITNRGGFPFGLIPKALRQLVDLPNLVLIRLQ